MSEPDTMEEGVAFLKTLHGFELRHIRGLYDGTVKDDGPLPDSHPFKRTLARVREIVAQHGPKIFEK